MTNFKKALGVLAVTAAFVVGGVAAAADRDWQKYDGSVSIDSTNFALIIGGSTGGGQLKFQDKTYDFKIAGLSAGVNVGVTKVEAAGFVYDLEGHCQVSRHVQGLQRQRDGRWRCRRDLPEERERRDHEARFDLEGPAAQRGRGVGRQGHDEVTGAPERRSSRYGAASGRRRLLRALLPLGILRNWL